MIIFLIAFTKEIPYTTYFKNLKLTIYSGNYSLTDSLYYKLFLK